jgi:hypothetical protein
MNIVDTETIATRVMNCPSVVELSGGPTGSVATYLPRRRVLGIRVHGGRIEVHVVGRWEVPVSVLAAEVRTAVAGLVDGRSVEVVVEDLGDEIIATEGTATA